jgi:hypothetical protein
MFQRSFAATGSLWPRTDMRYVGGPLAAWPAFAALLAEFERALSSVPGPQASAMRSRIRGAANHEDLLPLRTEIREMVARTFDAWEAGVRLRDLEGVLERMGLRGPGAAP